MRAVLYARYSSDNQRDASIEDQLRLCREFAQRQDWQVTECYTDHAVSGASLLRSGIQALMGDATSGTFNVVIAESLDRLSRDQEDIAGLYKRMTFAGVQLVTLSEGTISELHIGLKGTMGALYLKDLAEKTRRGLRGRVEAGKSGGGKSYGYNVITNVSASGDLERGEREINAEEAAVVRRIFNDYADGKSPRKIAHELNAEDIPSPSGKAWGTSTIHGNVQRGTGVLNNELYIGRLVWNRLRYMKDPDTGRRVSRLNPEEDWIVNEVPEQRIVEQDVWDRVKARQAAHRLDRSLNPENPMLPHRRARHLFSGLTKCGVCGGGYSVISQTHLGCSTARNKGTCDNRRSIKREQLEERVLNALRHQLMHPKLFEEFCDAFTAEVNRMRIEQRTSNDARKGELDRIDRELKKLLEALKAGGPMETIVEEMKAMEARKAELANELGNADDPPPLLHPNMAGIYRERIDNLYKALNDDEGRSAAAEIIRTLIDEIVVTPQTGTMSVELRGDLAGILTLARANKKPAKGKAVGGQDQLVSLVAGAGFEPATFRL